MLSTSSFNGLAVALVLGAVLIYLAHKHCEDFPAELRAVLRIAAGAVVLAALVVLTLMIDGVLLGAASHFVAR